MEKVLTFLKTKMHYTGLFILTLYWVSVAGQDTTYFDKSWQRTIKDSAIYYRLITIDSTGYRFDDHYLNGKLQMTGYSLSKDSLFKNGLFRYYNEDGIMVLGGNYTKDIRTGRWSFFYPDGHLYYVYNYSYGGLLDGEAKYYFKNGKVKRSETYSMGVLKHGKCFSISGQDTAWFPFWKPAEFRGGEKKRIRYLNKNIKYPEYVKNLGIEGRMIVTFIVEADGSINEVEVTKGVFWLLDYDVLTVISKMPPWLPGQNDGTPVRMQLNMPISFWLFEDQGPLFERTVRINADDYPD